VSSGTLNPIRPNYILALCHLLTNRCVVSLALAQFLVYLRQRRRYVRLPAMFVYLSVCLLARLLKNACMDLDEILHVDRCRDMDELINF